MNFGDTMHWKHSTFLRRFQEPVEIITKSTLFPDYFSRRSQTTKAKRSDILRPRNQRNLRLVKHFYAWSTHFEWNLINDAMFEQQNYSSAIWTAIMADSKWKFSVFAHSFRFGCGSCRLPVPHRDCSSKKLRRSIQIYLLTEWSCHE